MKALRRTLRGPGGGGCSGGEREHMDKQEIRDTVNRLVEAWHDQEVAEQQLDIYKASHPTPKPPDQFDGLEELYAFEEKKRSHQAGLSEHQNQLKAAQKAYREAGNKLRWVLPENVGLQYTYQGARRNLEGGRYLLVNTQGSVIVRWHTPPERPPL